MASNLSIALMIGASVGGAMAGIKRLQKHAAYFKR
ncbi:Uncharacterised protein [Pasteurella bettyae]|nr:Uncharacterised protein [Pasteurella bettyae]